MSFTCSCGCCFALCSFVKATGGSLIEFPQLIRRENTRTHKSKSTTIVVYAARAMEIAPVHSSGSHEGAWLWLLKRGAKRNECRSRRLLVCKGAQPCYSSAQRNSTTQLTSEGSRQLQRNHPHSRHVVFCLLLRTFPCRLF